MKTDWLRTSLIAGIAFLCFLLVIRWNDFQQRTQTLPAETETPASYSSGSNADATIPTDDSIPELTSAANDSTGVPSATPTTAVQNAIHIRTDVLDVTLDARGGDIVKVSLPQYPDEIDTPDNPFVLLESNSHKTYAARSGLIGQNGTDSKTKPRPVFQSERADYVLKEGQDSLVVDLFLEQEDGTRLTKRYRFDRSSYAVTISYLVDNTTSTPWRAALYGQIKRDSHRPSVSTGFGMQPFVGAATTTDEKNYDKLSFDDIADETLKHSTQGGWVAMVQHYFLTAWIPPQDATNQYELRQENSDGLYYLQFTSPAFSVAPNSRGETSFQFYAGPKDIRTLEEISPYLDLTVDYSFLWWIAKPLFYILDWIHDHVGNWGLAIILLTVLIKIVFFYPSATSYRSMAKMRKIQPKMAELKERYGDDRQRFSTEMMKLYRKEKVNPLSGCLPILIQMPVFLALYWVLMESVELRQAPFFLWIDDLSVKDPFYVLPLIMGLTMFIQQKLNPTPPDPMQAKIMQMMPVFFTFLMLFFPAGLVLYWVVNNTLSITQQYFITRHIEKNG